MLSTVLHCYSLKGIGNFNSLDHYSAMCIVSTTVTLCMEHVPALFYGCRAGDDYFAVAQCNIISFITCDQNVTDMARNQ